MSAEELYSIKMRASKKENGTEQRKSLRHRMLIYLPMR